jgi:DNA-binding winged helix-turn-helix (wHTH) protein/TolB-like protein/Tfp pilus assembly protein PilF
MAMNASISPGPAGSGRPRLRFEDFELRPDSGELLRLGSPVKLQPQPARVLEILASRSGEVVSREEIRQLVWGDSFVDLDSSLNFCIKEIRRVLGDSATSPTYVETVPRRGYRFLKPVTVEPAPGAVESPTVTAPVTVLPSQPQRWPRLGTVGAFVVLLILLTLLVGSRLRPSSPRLAVLPLDCRGQDLADRQVCSGLTDALTVELTRRLSREIDVIAPFSVQAYAGSKPSEIERGLRATVILNGEATPSAQGLQLKVALTRSGNREPLWSDSFDVELQDAPLVYEQIAREVARALRLSPLPNRPAGAKPSRAAYESYLRGVSLRHQRQYEPAAKSFQDAVLLDPGFASAWAELALCRVRNDEEVDATEAAARRALALDPTLADAHVAVAQVLFRHALDWEGAGREYRRGLALNPGSFNAYSAYSYYLMALGRSDEALAAMQRARELNPASMEFGAAYTWYLYLDRRYQEVLRETPGTLGLYPLNAAVTTEGALKARRTALDTRLLSALMLGDRDAALQTAKEIEATWNGPQGAARLHTLDDFWQAREQRIRERTPHERLDPYSQAKNALMLGDRDRALRLLTSECNPEGWVAPFAAVEPLFDPLRSDPRWSQVLDCLELPADAPARKSRQ